MWLLLYKDANKGKADTLCFFKLQKDKWNIFME